MKTNFNELVDELENIITHIEKYGLEVENDFFSGDAFSGNQMVFNKTKNELNSLAVSLANCFGCFGKINGNDADEFYQTVEDILDEVTIENILETSDSVANAESDENVEISEKDNFSDISDVDFDFKEIYKDFSEVEEISGEKEAVEIRRSSADNVVEFLDWISDFEGQGNIEDLGDYGATDIPSLEDVNDFIKQLKVLKSFLNNN